MPLKTLNMAARAASDELTGLDDHLYHDSNNVSLRYTDRIIELGGTPSVGSKGARFDNPQVESRFALVKSELIKKGRPWRTVEHVELATLEQVQWFNKKLFDSEL